MSRAEESRKVPDRRPAGDRAGDAGRRGSRRPEGIAGFPGALWRELRGGRLDALPAVVGIVAIWIVFEILTGGDFLSARNLSNLSVDIVGTGMIAVGIVFVLLTGEIDLSVGSLSAFAAAVFAVLNVQSGLPEWLAAVLAVVCGAAAGSLQGFVFARLGVPSFAVTLAGLLGWAALTAYILSTNGTLNFDDQGLVATLTSHFFHDVAVAYGLAGLATALFLLGSSMNWRHRMAAGLPCRPYRRILLRTGVLAVIAFAAAAVLNQFLGLPLAFLIFLVVVVGLDHVLRRTPYGRKVVALGGGVEAARRAGINVVGVRASVFAVSGALAAVGGLFLASRIASTIQTSSSATLLVNATAAAVIGGTSLFGGRGSTWAALVGILVIQSIASGMALMGIQASVQLLITSGVLLVAVILDSLVHRAQKAHGLA